ncbi:MAG: hypothetical protein NVS4B3_00060 [Gemmatimonadaceae bacterium]
MATPGGAPWGRPLRRALSLVIPVGISIAAPPLVAQLYQSAAFTITDSSVRQGRFEAVALSRDTIVSSYPRAAREVRFKFSINGEENEFRPGTEHTIYIRPRNGEIVTPVYTFGVEQPPVSPLPEGASGSEEGIARVTFRLDLRAVLRSFRESGVYRPPNGRPIHTEEFQGVYVVGGTEPLTWDFSTLHPGSPLQLIGPGRDSIYTVTLPIEALYTRPQIPDGRAIWARQSDLSAFPQLISSQRLPDALYRMSLEELQQLVRSDGALAAGAKWPGVWTRDISLSTVLGLALVIPDAVRQSLLAKVDSAGRIIQDTGTGGSWPISTDRMSWALAAWELYAATGDRGWLQTAYDVVRRSAEADLHAAFDPTTELFRGESSFLDWREQSYPRWMEPRDIYQSQALGTNIVHYGAYRVLADMARELGKPSERWSAIADTVRRGINAHLWQADRGWYGQFRYGRLAATLSPRSEGLGESLSIIYGAATLGQRTRLVQSTPVVAFGMPSFWPYIADVKSYHNAAIWPFVTAYWGWAAAEAGNTAGVEHALASIYRPAALFLTNKENMAAATGHFEGTELNSDRQLWSVAATLATTFRMLFGIRLHHDRLVFRPMVPRSYNGDRTLRGLRYRNALLTVVIRGFGDGVASARLDERRLERAEISARLVGEHRLVVTMNGRWGSGHTNIVDNRYAPATPHAVQSGDTVAWRPVQGAVRYAVYRDGRHFVTTPDTSVRVASEAGAVEHQVLAIDATGLESFLSEPVRQVPDAAVLTVKPTQDLERVFEGFTGAGYTRLTGDRNTTLELPSVRVSAAGVYAIEARYANGSGPINSGDKAAVRTLLVDGRPVGVLVMPHRGTDLWTDWGYTNSLSVPLSAGAHTVTVAYTPLDRNMSGRVSTALLDYVRVTRRSAAAHPGTGSW